MKRSILLLLLAQTIGVTAQIGGNGVHTFASVSPNARIISLGGNLNMIRDNDLNTVAQNPALLNESMNNRIAFNYLNHFSDINAGNILYANKFGTKGSFATNLQFLNYGKFTQAESNSDIVGDFSAADYSLGLSYGRTLDSNFSVGATVKTLYSNFNEYNSIAVGLDIGISYFHAKKNTSFSFLIKNIGGELKPYLAGQRNGMTPQIQAGAAKKLKHVPFRISCAFDNLQKFRLAERDTTNPSLLLSGEEKVKKGNVFLDNVARHLIIGGELLLTKNFNIRFGYNYKVRKELVIASRKAMVGFSFGIGLKISKFNLSYGRMAYSLAGASNAISISTDINSFKNKRK